MPDIYVADDTEKKEEPVVEKTEKKEEEKTTTSVQDSAVYAAEEVAATKEKRNVKEYSEVMRSLKQTKNPLTAFMVRPKKVRVEIQDDEEKVLLLLRRHVITNVPWIVVGILMSLAPIVFAYVPIFTFLPGRFMFMGTILWYLLTFAIVLEGFLSWFFNVYIITDERVIDVDFLNLLYKNISAAKIENIEDVTVEMTGTLQSILNYGTIFIQTAAEKTEFEFDDVPHPQKVAKFLNEMILEEEREELEGRVR